MLTHHWRTTQFVDQVAWHKLRQARKYLFECGFSKEAMSLLLQLSTDPWKCNSVWKCKLKTNALNPVHVTGLDSDEEGFQKAWGSYCSPSHRPPSPPCSESTNTRSVSKLPHHCPGATAVLSILSEGCHIPSCSLLHSLSLPLVPILFFSYKIGR